MLQCVKFGDNMRHLLICRSYFQRIRGFTTMRYIKQLFTYLLHLMFCSFSYIDIAYVHVAMHLIWR